MCFVPRSFFSEKRLTLFYFVVILLFRASIFETNTYERICMNVWKRRSCRSCFSFTKHLYRCQLCKHTTFLKFSENDDGVFCRSVFTPQLKTRTRELTLRILESRETSQLYISVGRSVKAVHWPGPLVQSGPSTCPLIRALGAVNILMWAA